MSCKNDFFHFNLRTKSDLFFWTIQFLFSFFLRENKVKLFINNADPEIRDICKKIINNTEHISFEKFIKTLNINIKEFIKNCGYIKSEINNKFYELKMDYLYLDVILNTK